MKSTIGRSIGGFGMFLPGIHMEVPELGGGGDEMSLAAGPLGDAAAPAPEAPAAPEAAQPPVDGAPSPEAPAASEAPAETRSYSEAELEAELEARLAPFMEHMPLLEAIAAAAGEPEGLGLEAPPAGDLSGLGELDPLSDDFGAQLDARLEQRDQKLLQGIQQMLAPIHGRFETEAVQEGDQRAQDILADDISRNGEITDDGKTLARQLAEQYFPEFASKYGQTPKAGEAALTKAAATVRAIEKASGEKAVEAYKNQLATLSGAPQTPGTGATGIVSIPEGGDELSLARHYASRVA
jgi:hypothetical protein